MCTAMLGATPVYLCTWAASSAFSKGLRGTPGCANTLNRVPLFPNAQDGSSIWCCRSASLTAFLSTTKILVSCRGCHFGKLGAQQFGRIAQFVEQVAGAERPVMRDPGRAPRVGPLAGVAAEIHSGGGVTDLEQRAGHDGADRGDERVGAVSTLRDAEGSNRSVLHVELDGDTPAALPVVNAETPKDGLAVADAQVRGAVVAHLHHAVAEVQCLQLGEGSAAAAPVGDEHRQRRPQLVLADRRDAARGEQRRPEDHAGAEPFMLLALKTAVIVGQAVEGEVLDQRVQADGAPGGPFRVRFLHGTVDGEDALRRRDP